METETVAVKVLAISGSLRKDSDNRKALQHAKRLAAAAGGDVEELDLKTLALPMYDGDLEVNGIPDSAKTLKKRVEDAQVLIIATPEYNHSVSGALKNAIDWLTRDDSNSLAGKYAVILGVSVGIYGTVRAQAHLRQILTALDVIMLPQPQVLIGPAATAFTADGALADKVVDGRLKTLIEKTLQTVEKMR
jgi:chromate reductase